MDECAFSRHKWVNNPFLITVSNYQFQRFAIWDPSVISWHLEWYDKSVWHLDVFNFLKETYGPNDLKKGQRKKMQSELFHQGKKCKSNSKMVQLLMYGRAVAVSNMNLMLNSFHYLERLFDKFWWIKDGFHFWRILRNQLEETFQFPESNRYTNTATITKMIYFNQQTYREREA